MRVPKKPTERPSVLHAVDVANGRLSRVPSSQQWTTQTCRIKLYDDSVTLPHLSRLTTAAGFKAADGWLQVEHEHGGGEGYDSWGCELDLWLCFESTSCKYCQKRLDERQPAKPAKRARHQPIRRVRQRRSAA